jgi:hypothetical protein
MKQKTKQSVLVFTDKRAFFGNGHRKPSIGGNTPYKCLYNRLKVTKV